MKKTFLISLFSCLTVIAAAQQFPVTFDNLAFPEGETHWKGTDYSGGFESNGFHFSNTYDSVYDYWTGTAYSREGDTSTAGYLNQFSSYSGGGIQQTTGFAIFTGGAVVKKTDGKPFKLNGFYATNSTYAALSMRDGDMFAKKFGGISGTDKDYFRVVFTGMYGGNVAYSQTLTLADFTADDNQKDYILKSWKWVETGNWGMIDSLTLYFESSDTGAFGINTPQFVCIDDFNAINITPKPNCGFEDFSLKSSTYWNGSNSEGGFTLHNMYFANNYNSAWDSWSGWAVSSEMDTITEGFANQYSCISGKGAMNSTNYLVGYDKTEIRFAYGTSLATTGANMGIYVNNSTYAYKSMLKGDAYAKKFGGKEGNDPDYFRLLIDGYRDDGTKVGTDTFYLADFRFADSQKDYIVKDWQFVDLSNLVLNMATRLQFSLQSSDTGTFGMNTPAYFCMDDVLSSTTGRTATAKLQKITTYPNPAKDHIRLSEAVDQIKILDLSGEELANISGLINEIDLTMLKPGMYILMCRKGNYTVSSKFIRL